MQAPHRNSAHCGETWLEPEMLCYPSGGMKRRARVSVIDPLTGEIQYRIVRCGLPDTYFSIPAKLDGVKGFISMDSGEFTFNYDKI